MRGFGLSYECYRQHLRRDPEFRAAVVEARECYVDSLRSEVHRRGVEGWDEPVFYRGVQCGVRRRYSDALLLSHLARFDPRYRPAVAVERRPAIFGGGSSTSPIADLSAEARVALAVVFETEREALARRRASERTVEGTVASAASAAP